MWKHVLIGGTVLALLAGPAAASSCPRHMAAIDKALADNPKLSGDRLNEVRKLRAEGEQLHKSGQHQESVEVLTRAERMLGTAK